jgi:hypothetical protein
MRTTIGAKMSDGGGITNREIAEKPDALRHRRRTYEHFEICLSCVMWPAVAILSAVVLYWLWLDDPYYPGIGAKLASTIFVAVLIAALFCSIDLLVTFVGRLLGDDTTHEG